MWPVRAIVHSRKHLMRYGVRLFAIGLGVAFISLLAACASTSAPSAPRSLQFERIKHIVFIIQENHTFDSIFGGPGGFPGADTASSGKNSNGDSIALQPRYMGDSGGQTGLAN